MDKDLYFVKTSQSKIDFEHMRPFLAYDKKLILWAVKVMRRLRKNATRTEVLVGKYMSLCRIIYIAQAPFVFDVDGELKCYFADFYIPALRLIIEIDGRSHMRPEHLEYDIARDACFLRSGISTLRIPASDVKNGTYKKIIPIPDERFLRRPKVEYLAEEKPRIENNEDVLRKALMR